MRTKSLMFILVILVAALTLIVCARPTLSAEEKWYPFEVESVYPWGDTIVEDFNPPKKASRPYKLGVSVIHLKDPYYVNMAYGLVSEAESLGCELKLLAAGGYDDLPTQISQVENLVQVGIDALLLGAMSFEGTARVVEETIDKGVPVFMLGTTTKSNRISAVAIANDYKLGYDLGQWVIKDSGGKANVVLLSGPSGTTWTMLVSKGFHHAVRGYPGIKILDERWTDVDVAIGQSTMENLLQVYPDLNYVATNASIGHGAANALIAAKKTDTIKLAMVYAYEETFPYIRNGSVDVGFSEPTVILGRIAVDLAVKKLNGEEVPFIVHPWSVGITKENIDKLDRTHFFAPKDWRVPGATGE